MRKHTKRKSSLTHLFALFVAALFVATGCVDGQAYAEKKDEPKAETAQKTENLSVIVNGGEHEFTGTVNFINQSNSTVSSLTAPEDGPVTQSLALDPATYVVDIAGAVVGQILPAGGPEPNCEYTGPRSDFQSCVWQGYVAFDELDNIVAEYPDPIPAPANEHVTVQLLFGAYFGLSTDLEPLSSEAIADVSINVSESPSDAGATVAACGVAPDDAGTPAITDICEVGQVCVPIVNVDPNPACYWLCDTDADCVDAQPGYTDCRRAFEFGGYEGDGVDAGPNGRPMVCQPNHLQPPIAP